MGWAALRADSALRDPASFPLLDRFSGDHMVVECLDDVIVHFTGPGSPWNKSPLHSDDDASGLDRGAHADAMSRERYQMSCCLYLSGSQSTALRCSSDE